MIIFAISSLLAAYSPGIETRSIRSEIKRLTHEQENKPGSTQSKDNSQLLYITLAFNTILDKLDQLKTHPSGTTDNELIERVIGIEESINKLTNELSLIKRALSNVEENTITKYHELKAVVNDIRDRADRKDQELEDAINSKAHVSGTTYISRGRTTCPGNGSENVYSGYAGGSFYDHKGAAVSMLCLPKNPDWAMHSEASDIHSGFIFGVEYQPSNGRTDAFFGKNTTENDVPCVVGNIRSRSTIIMVPGKTSCHAGWTLEYAGYLMSG